MFSVWHEISEKSVTFTPADKKLAAVIMVCPEQVIELTIKQLAERAETSEAAIVRFSRKIGLSGYRELKLKLARELDDTHVELNNHKVMLEDSTQVLTQKVFNNAISALARTEKLMKADDLQAAAELISGSSQLLLVESAEMTVMRDFKTKLMTLNKRADVVTHYSTAAVIMAHMKQEDTVIVSVAVNDDSQRAVIEQAAAKALNIIMLCQTEQHPLRPYADVVLLTSAEENQQHIAMMNGRIIQFVVLDCLYMKLRQMMSETVTHYISGMTRPTHAK